MTHDLHVVNAVRNAVSSRLKGVFGNPPNMTRAEQHEHACLVEADQFLATERDRLLAAQTDAPAYPKVLVGPGGATRKVASADDEATARLDGFDYPPAEVVVEAPPAEVEAPLLATEPTPAKSAKSAPTPAPAA